MSELLVYKLKKAKNFGFFDYSTPAQRRYFCQQEVYLNRILAPHIYLGVAPVLMSRSRQFRLGPVYLPEQVPEPGVFLDGELVVDYAVVMVRLPDEATLEAKVRAGTASPSLLTAIARTVATFHQQSPQNEAIARWGGREVIRQNWEENFMQIQPYIGRTFSKGSYDHIVSYVRGMMQERARLFDTRVRAGCIRDCHGDLRLQHVYVLDAPGAPRTVTGNTHHEVAILDRIEFNERFRYSDVASEIAFLSMELDAAGRSDLSQAFVDAYIRETGDRILRELLPFYACYRAFVRGKVLSFQLDEQEVPIDQRELGWQLFSSDILRKRLANLDPGQPRTETFGQGMYDAQWTARTYDSLREEACKTLACGRSVILDASFSKRVNRSAMIQEALKAGATPVFIECCCPPEVALKRLARRWRARVEASSQNLAQPSAASDGRPELYQAQASSWEAIAQEIERPLRHILIETTQRVEVSVERVLAALPIPHLACRLYTPH